MMRYRTRTPDGVSTPAWPVPIAHPTRIIHLCDPGTAVRGVCVRFPTIYDIREWNTGGWPRQKWLLSLSRRAMEKIPRWERGKCSKISDIGTMKVCLKALWSSPSQPCKHTGRTATRAVKNNQILNSLGKISGGAGRLAPCTRRLHHRHQQQDTRREAVLRHQLLALASPPPPPPPLYFLHQHPRATLPYPASPHTSPSSLRFLLYSPQQAPPRHPIPPHSHSSPSLHSLLPLALFSLLLTLPLLPTSLFSSCLNSLPPGLCIVARSVRLSHSLTTHHLPSTPARLATPQEYSLQCSRVMRMIFLPLSPFTLAIHGRQIGF